MSILGVNNFLTTPYQCTNKSQKVTPNSTGFTEKLQIEKKIAEIADKQDILMFSGDVVVSQPPNYSGFNYNRNISNKSKEEMTLDEYKQWFMNEMSQMPVSAWYCSTCVGGSLVITDKAFEKMKSDPEWENTVMNMVKKMYSVNGIMGSKMIGFQVIGASPEECYGEGIPVDNSLGLSAISNDKKSWWQKRLERMEELLLEEQSKRAAQKLYEHRWEMQEFFNARSLDTRGIENVAMSQVIVSAVKSSEKNIVDLSAIKVQT